MTALLARYATCDQVLADKDALFSNRKPTFLMISDRKMILSLEVGLNGRYAVRAVRSGTVAHSNHFLEASLTNCNLTIGQSSATRLERITNLLQGAPKPLNTAAIVTMSRDQRDGTNNSLWRTGPGSRTLSSWIVETPASGAPTLRVLLANPGQPEQIQQFALDQEFWRDGRFENRGHGNRSKRGVVKDNALITHPAQ